MQKDENSQVIKATNGSWFRNIIRKLNIQMLIALSFTALSVFAMIFFGLTLYKIFDNRMVESVESNSEQLLGQTASELEAYLQGMRQIHNAINYSVINVSDLSEANLVDSMNLIYEANKDNLVSIGCYTSTGKLVAAVPADNVKKNSSVLGQDWFISSIREQSSLHTSLPHVQNLFDYSSYRYYWVVSLSGFVSLNNAGKVVPGVLVIDMNYNSIERLFNDLNREGSQSYTYLMDRDGTLIYHPRGNLIVNGIQEENNLEIARMSDGSFVNSFDGEQRIVTVKTISNTGWRIVQVTPKKSISMGMRNTRFAFIGILLSAIVILIVLNQLISYRLSNPLKKLTDSIGELNEDGLPIDIYIGGSREIRYLGDSLKELVDRLRQLMNDVVLEQEQKRKSELEALQSQINPHFLYNTLDSIVWMIEGEHYEDAIFMITQLASFFRISLSKGKTMITIEDEIKHAKTYMNIQHYRYKDKFEIEYDVDPDILKCVTVKLVLQPILENALYYAVEALPGEGEITVRGYKKDGDIYLEVQDNGLGMQEETVEKLLVEGAYVQKHGSGVGLINIHKRIQIRFGQEYGLIIKSKPDEGTIVTLHLPYQEYEDVVGDKEVRHEK